MPDIHIVRQPISRAQLQSIADERFGDMAKAVVDCDKKIMALGGELHADEEALLLAQGSLQKNLWGINLYPAIDDDTWLEFDSMINIRPGQGNRSRGIEDISIQEVIKSIVKELINS